MSRAANPERNAVAGILPILLALGAAASWGFSAVLVRTAMRDVATRPGTLISLLAGLVLTAAVVLVVEPARLADVGPSALLIFGIVGMLNFPIGRFCNYMAMARLGVGRSTPILGSAPLFAVIVAVVFTGESLHIATAAGIALILGGLYVTIMAPR